MNLALLMLGALGVVVVAALAFIVVRGSGVFRHHSQEYAANPYSEDHPERAQLLADSSGFRVVRWRLTDDSEQVAYYHPPQNGSVIVIAHGSPGRGVGLALAEGRGLVAAGYGVLSLDLPGYGDSEGDRRWDDRFVEAISRGLDFAVAQEGVDRQRIVGLGYSNGGCAMARAAVADDRIRALILLAAYTNLTDQLHFAYRRRVPGMGHFAVASARAAGVPVEALDTVAALETMRSRPTLIIAGGRDKQVPPEMALHLKSAASEAELWEYPQMGHVGFAARLGSEFFARLDEWLSRAVPENSARGARQVDLEGAPSS